MWDVVAAGNKQNIQQNVSVNKTLFCSNGCSIGILLQNFQKFIKMKDVKWQKYGILNFFSFMKYFTKITFAFFIHNACKVSEYRPEKLPYLDPIHEMTTHLRGFKILTGSLRTCFFP